MTPKGGVRGQLGTSRDTDGHFLTFGLWLLPMLVRQNSTGPDIM